MITEEDLTYLKRQLDYAKTSADIEVNHGMEYLAKEDNQDSRNYVKRWKLNASLLQDAIDNLNLIKIEL